MVLFSIGLTLFAVGFFSSILQFGSHIIYIIYIWVGGVFFYEQIMKCDFVAQEVMTFILFRPSILFSILSWGIFLNRLELCKHNIINFYHSLVLMIKLKIQIYTKLKVDHLFEKPVKSFDIVVMFVHDRNNHLSNVENIISEHNESYWCPNTNEDACYCI